MIQANVAPPRRWRRSAGPLVYRIHDEPSWEKLEALREFLGSLDMSFPKAGNLRPSQFNRVLARVADTPNALLVNEVVLRSQSQAEYAVREHRPFRPQPPPLRPFHLADPPLRRPPRPPRR